MSVALAISIDARAGFQRVGATFARLPVASERAMGRALRKLSTWLKRQVLRAASAASRIPQTFFQRAFRYHVVIDKDGSTPTGVSVWIGTNPIKAHRLGVVRWNRRMKGARVGRKGYPGAWSWGRGKTGPAVMSRAGDARLPLVVETEAPHPAVLARLQQIQGDAETRFERLLTQELNYALNHEAGR